jgi:hypothetical protein
MSIKSDVRFFYQIWQLMQKSNQQGLHMDDDENQQTDAVSIAMKVYEM